MLVSYTPELAQSCVEQSPNTQQSLKGQVGWLLHWFL